MEKSFRSVLPSESHWRGSVERKRQSDEEPHPEKSSNKVTTHTHSVIISTKIYTISATFLPVCLSVSCPSRVQQDGSVPVFSADQYSFSEFTMAMVKQCMQEEEVRSRHQSSLLRLRHRALKEKTRAELDWLELQKRQETPPTFTKATLTSTFKVSPTRTPPRSSLLYLLYTHCFPDNHSTVTDVAPPTFLKLHPDLENLHFTKA